MAAAFLACAWPARPVDLSQLRGSESAAPDAIRPAAPETEVPVPPFIDLRANVVEFEDREAIEHLSARWSRHQAAPVVIAHFGDSHVQKGYLTEAARLVLQERAGSGGRGMVFPYAIAKTYSQNDFDSTFTGVWRTANSIQQPPKLPVGISGFVATTTDPSVNVTLAFKRPLDPGPKRIELFYRAVGAPYRLALTTGGFSPVQLVPQSGFSEVSVAEFDVQQASDVIELQIDQTELGLGTFELHGIDIENADSSGVIYHNLGVGGAVYDAINEQTWFEQGIREIHPDLVILDLGTNDIVFNNAVAPNFEETVRRAIARVRAAAPRASILLTSTQDMTFRHHEITAAADLSEVMRRIAIETGCLYWDWYRISGGAGSRQLWQAETLAGGDGIHLTSRGYELKGQLFADALLQAIDFAEDHPQANALLAPPTHVDDPIGELLRTRRYDPD
jgi:lysophospholipase L1-like esterase